MPDTSMQVCAYGLTKVLGDGTVTLWGNTAGGGGFACGVQARDTFLLAASLPRLLSRDEPKDAKSSRGSSTVARLATWPLSPQSYHTSTVVDKLCLTNLLTYPSIDRTADR